MQSTDLQLKKQADLECEYWTDMLKQHKTGNHTLVHFGDHSMVWGMRSWLSGDRTEQFEKKAEEEEGENEEDGRKPPLSNSA